MNDKNTPYSRCVLLGQPSVNLRFLAVYADDDYDLNALDFEEIDNNFDFNGDHSFIENNPSFQITKESVLVLNKKPRYFRKIKKRRRYFKRPQKNCRGDGSV